MANEARRSILKGMQDHPHSVILSELIFKRMPFDVLALITPIVLEKIEDGYSSFDALTSVDFCSYLLNRHYKSDAILELLGQEFYKENKRKPDRLSEVAKIIQKRLDLKNNKKSLKRKASIEFEKDEPFVKFSRSYLVTTKESKPKGFENESVEGDLLFFKINRDENKPKMELVKNSFSHAGTMYSGMLEPFIFFSQALTARQINLETLLEDTDSTTWCLSDCDIKKMSFNFSRQRTWRDFITNPLKSIHPVVKSDPAEEDEDDDDDDDDNEENDVRSVTRTVDFTNFSGGERKIIWTYDLNLKGKYRGCYNMFARFIDDCHWLIIAEVFDSEGDDKMIHVDLKKRKVSSYIFPTCFWAETAFYGLFESRLYYVREVDNPYCALSKHLVFGYLQNPDTDDCEENPDCLNYLCFFERGQMTKEARVKIGTGGFVHLVLKPEDKKSKVFTFTIDLINQLMAKTDKLSTKIDFPQENEEETTLPLIKLDELCIEKYEDSSEDLDPEQCDIGFMEGNKLHLLV